MTAGFLIRGEKYFDKETKSEGIPADVVKWSLV